MAIVRRYYEVIGVAEAQLEELLQERRRNQAAANQLAQTHGFDKAALESGMGYERVSGFLMKNPDATPDETAWKVAGETVDGERVWMPKRTSRARRSLSNQIYALPVCDRLRMLAVFGLEQWTVEHAVGGSQRVHGAAIGKMAGRWIVMVPENEIPDEEGKCDVFEGHHCLQEITLAQYRQYQADHAAEKEAA